MASCKQALGDSVSTDSKCLLIRFSFLGYGFKALVKQEAIFHVGRGYGIVVDVIEDWRVFVLSYAVVESTHQWEVYAVVA